MRTIILFLLFSNLFLSFGQGSFVKWISSTENESLGKINKTGNNNFLVIIYRGYQYDYLERFFNEKDILYILDQEGSFTDSLTLTSVGEYGLIIKNMIRSDENGILLWAKARKADLQDEQLCLIRLDHNLNLLEYSIYGLESRKEIVNDFTINLDGNIIFVGNTELYTSESDFFFWKFDMALQELGFHIGFTGMFFGYYVHQLPSSGQYFIDDLRFSQEFVFDTFMILPNVDVFMSIPHSHKLFDDSRFLKIGMYMTQVPSLDPWDNAFLLLDNEYNIESFCYFGAPDTTDYAGAIDCNEAGEIYLGGTKNYEASIPEDSWFMLHKTNLDCDTLMAKFYGGHGRYRLTSLTVTDDNGCLMGGTWWDFYNYPVPNHQYDIVLIKVDENGLVTGTDDNIPFEIADIIVFPNPGKNTLNIHSMLKGLTVYLFNQEGKQLLSESFDGNTVIPTGNLKPGIYLYQIVQKDRILKSGKWIKE